MPFVCVNPPKIPQQLHVLNPSLLQQTNINKETCNSTIQNKGKNPGHRRVWEVNLWEKPRTGLMRGYLIYNLGNCWKPQAQHQRRKKVRVRKSRSRSKWGRGERKQKCRVFQHRKRGTGIILTHCYSAGFCRAFAQPHLENTLFQGKKGSISCLSPLRRGLSHYPALVHSAPSHSPEHSSEHFSLTCTRLNKISPDFFPTGCLWTAPHQSSQLFRALF